MLPGVSRRLLFLTAVIFTAVGVVMYLAPERAASNFPWNVSPFTAMTIGSWFLGSAFVSLGSWLLARRPIVYPGLLFLGTFAVLELLVVAGNAGQIRWVEPLSLGYLAGLVLALFAALTAVLDRHQSSTEDSAFPVPALLRVLSIGFVAVSGYIGISLLSGRSTGGRIWPGFLTPLTGRAFGAFYLSLAIAVLPLVFARSIAPVLALLVGAVVGSILITIPALVYIRLFDFRDRPGGLAYIGTYVFVLVVASVILLSNRSRIPRRYAST